MPQTLKRKIRKRKSNLHITQKRRKNKPPRLSQLGGKIICDKSLGVGMFGTVLLCDKNGTNYAVKFLQSYDESVPVSETKKRARINQQAVHLNEIAIFKQLYDATNKNSVSENILRYYDLDDQKEGEVGDADNEIEFKNPVFAILSRKDIIVTEACDFDLLDMINGKPPVAEIKIFDKTYEFKPQNANPPVYNEYPVTLYIASQIFDGLFYLFGRKIIHYDIKPENILVKKIGDKYVFKIADFGLALNDGIITAKPIEVRGTMEYNPPAKFYKTTFYRDIYAFIMTLYTLCEYMIYNTSGKPTHTLTNLFTDLKSEKYKNSAIKHYLHLVHLTVLLEYTTSINNKSYEKLYKDIHLYFINELDKYKPVVEHKELLPIIEKQPSIIPETAHLNLEAKVKTPVQSVKSRVSVHNSRMSEESGSVGSRDSLSHYDLSDRDGRL